MSVAHQWIPTFVLTIPTLTPGFTPPPPREAPQVDLNVRGHTQIRGLFGVDMGWGKAGTESTMVMGGEWAQKDAWRMPGIAPPPPPPRWHNGGWAGRHPPPPPDCSVAHFLNSVRDVVDAAVPAISPEPPRPVGCLAARAPLHLPCAWESVLMAVLLRGLDGGAAPLQSSVRAGVQVHRTSVSGLGHLPGAPTKYLQLPGERKIRHVRNLEWRDSVRRKCGPNFLNTTAQLGTTSPDGGTRTDRP